MVLYEYVKNLLNFTSGIKNVVFDKAWSNLVDSFHLDYSYMAVLRKDDAITTLRRRATELILFVIEDVLLRYPSITISVCVTVIFLVVKLFKKILKTRKRVLVMTTRYVVQKLKYRARISAKRHQLRRINLRKVKQLKTLQKRTAFVLDIVTNQRKELYKEAVRTLTLMEKETERSLLIKFNESSASDSDDTDVEYDTCEEGEDEINPDNTESHMTLFSTTGQRGSEINLIDFSDAHRETSNLFIEEDVELEPLSPEDAGPSGTVWGHDEAYTSGLPSHDADVAFPSSSKMVPPLSNDEVILEAGRRVMRKRGFDNLLH